MLCISFRAADIIAEQKCARLYIYKRAYSYKKRWVPNKMTYDSGIAVRMRTHTHIVAFCVQNETQSACVYKSALAVLETRELRTHTE